MPYIKKNNREKLMTYSFYTQKASATPQTESIPGRESEMIQGQSGGYMFDGGIWTMVRRCLILGTATDQFYSGKVELTGQFVDVLKQAIAENPKRVADEILYASDGHAVNNHAPILALVLLSMGDRPDAKQAFRDIFQQVVRTGSHFHEWVSYTKQLRGIGRTVREVAQSWLLRDDVKWLAYQMLKYQQRMGFSFKDELRLFKPKPQTDKQKFLFEWASGKAHERKSNLALQSENAPIPKWVGGQYDLEIIQWYEWLKLNPSQGKKAVHEGGLTHEMVTPICSMDTDVWQALFEQMPIGALLRNLGSLTEIGVIRFDKIENLNRIESILTSTERLKKGRIHPIDVLKALKTYESNGRLGKSSKTWQKVDRVMDILENALSLSFETMEPTGKVFLHAVDISGSMSWIADSTIGLKASEIAATMALSTAKAEQNYIIRGFSTEFKDLGITASDSFASACQKTSSQTFGGTDAAVAYQWAIANNIKVDVFCFWTDSESWAGLVHPSQALAQYRKRVNPHAKAIYTSINSNQITLVDPKDPLSFDFGGFDPSIPKAIQEIALM
jgi:60 kDa SS-A/Ro ribonucleoprotein